MSDRLQRILDSERAMSDFKTHCASDLHVELCGLFVLRAGEIEFVACENHAYDKKNSFLIHPADFVAQADTADVIGVGHSHVVGTSQPSSEDKVNSENCLLPFVIYQPEAQTIHTYDPNGEPIPFLGRTWSLGVSDCYTLLRDYYAQQDVQLKDYVRNSLAVLKTESMFLKHFKENGFHEINEPPKKNDAILMQVMANIPNHCAVLVDDNLILHHLQDRLSCREPYGGYWRRHTVKTLRHEKWL